MGVRCTLVLILACLALSACGERAGGDAASDRPTVILATTTSTVDSGLLDLLVPRFEEASGFAVKPLPLGSGQALELAERGEADVALVHSPQAEQAFVESGKAGRRLLVMHNSFLIAGPGSDRAGVGTATDVAEALRRIAKSESVFISRGDESGTHSFERARWTDSGVEPTGDWYQESGQGMGATLQIAAEKGGYTIADRGTYLATRESTGLAELFSSGPEMLNLYHVIEVDGSAGARVNVEGGGAFADFLVSPEAQAVIRGFGIRQYGEPLFVPDAEKSEEEVRASA